MKGKGKGKGKEQLLRGGETIMEDEDDRDKRSFHIVLSKSSVRTANKSLSIPCKFAREHLTKKPMNAELRVPGREETWPVGLIYQKDARPRKGGNLKAENLERVKFHSGWSKFVKENNLKVDNSCKFELIEGNNPQFEVVIQEIDNDDEHKDEDDVFIDSSSRPQKKLKSEPLSLGKKDTEIDNDDEHKDKDDIFIESSSQPQKRVKSEPPIPREKHTVSVKPDLIGVRMCGTDAYDCLLRLANEHLSAEPDHLQLWGPNNKIKHVEFSKANFQVDWIQFINDNNSTVDHSCVFQLLVESLSLFRVYFFPPWKKATIPRMEEGMEVPALKKAGHRKG